MAQDGSNGHQQGTDASNDHDSPPPATDTDTTLTLGPRENSNSGSSTGIPVAEDASKEKEEDVEELVGSASAGSTHSGAGQSKGKNSSAEVAAITDGTDDDNISKGKRKVAAGDSKGAGVRRKKQLPHVITERERRKRMKGMYADLHALLPSVPEKTDKATIVGETINFIRVLEGTVAKLEKRKRDIALARRAAAAVDFEAGSSSAAAAAPPPQPNAVAQGSLELPQGWAWLPKQEPKPAEQIGFQTWSGRNVVLSVANDDAFISVCVPRRGGVLVLVLSVLEKHRLDVITAQVTSDSAETMFTIQARVNAAAIKQLGGDPPASEDIYKLAVSEIMVWLSN